MTAREQKILTTGENLTLVVKTLEKRGFVQRKKSADDRRFFSLHLNGKGRKVISEVFPKQAAEITRVIGALAPEEQNELAHLCKKLGTEAASVANQGN